MAVKTNATHGYFNHILVSLDLISDYELTGDQAILLHKIYMLSQHEPCFASNKFLGQGWGKSANAISKLIARLSEKELVAVEIEYEENTKQVKRRLIHLNMGCEDETLSSDKQGVMPDCHGGSCQVGEENILDKNIIENKEKSNNINIITKKESQKQVFGEFENIHMTEESLNKLCMQYGKHDVMDMIERVSAWKKAKGKRYKDDYAGILNWIKKDDRMVTFKNRVDEMFDGILKGVKDKQFDLTRVNQMINDFRSEHFKEAEVLIQRLRQNKTMLKLKEGTL